MTTSTEFEEFKQIATVIAEARGEAKGLLGAVENLSKHLALLTQLMGRALDQAESVSTRAARMADAARVALAAKTASQDAVHAELQALREQSTRALR